MVEFLVIVIICAIFLAFMVHKMRVDKAWEEVADVLRLEYSGGGFLINPQLVGEVRGVSVVIRVHTVRTRWGKKTDRTYFTELNAELASSWNCKTQITKRGFLDAVAERFGGEDIKIGDEDFDREFRIRGSVSDEIGEALMVEEVQSGLRRLASTFDELCVEDGAIQVRNEGRVTNPHELILQITAIVDVTLELNAGIGAPTAPVPPPLPRELRERELFPDQLDTSPVDTSREATEPEPQSYSGSVW